MKFTLLDWSAILGYLLITLLLGIYFRGSAEKSVDDYFVSGRNVPWWLAGTSMVATTFAADTPLLVAGLVYTQGIAGNWLWWAFLLSGMLTVFLFARLWRRSGLMTDVQFAEIRYAGKPAAFLRGFRAVYLGLLMNCLILGWVTKAMIGIVGTTMGPTMRNWAFLNAFAHWLTNILGSMFAGTDGRALVICIFFLIPFTGIYVSLGGLSGVLWTDLFQFVLKMGIVIVVAYYAVIAAGGTTHMISKIEAMRAVNGGSDPLSFFPDFSRGFAGKALWTLPVITFVTYLGIQWWAFWYPGAEPGGGGYIAQRIFSARDEKQGLYSVLWFNIAHYALRPWPWILTALAAIVLYPGLSHPETSYMMIVNDYVPHALRGIVLAGFLAAFMSTIATQLNWGSSYLIGDVYRRFLKRDASERHYVRVSRIITLLLVAITGYVAAHLGSIRSGWEDVLQLGAGTGAVYILRWFWWRINAWSEISAMASSLAATLALDWHTFWLRVLNRPTLFTGDSTVQFAKDALTTTLITTIVWVIVTFATKPERDEILVSFYRKVRPQVNGWGRIAAKAPEIRQTRELGSNLYCWILGCAMVYCALFGAGKLLLHRWEPGALLSGLTIVFAWALSRQLGRSAIESNADLAK
ncbi:MAG TPA: sodium:solute symporter family protein [Candidatus Acidoferrales bacterium]|nr:sodium:solute symporter family protein [Candidatus Acidoferrales bacterium]